MAITTSTIGTITGAGTLSLDINGASAVTVQILGTWSGLLQFEAVTDTGTYFQVSGFDRVLGDGSLYASTTANSTFTFNVAGYTNFRIVGVGVTGTANIEMGATEAPLQLVGIEQTIYSSQPSGTTYKIGSGAKGTSTAQDVTSTASGANHQGLDVIIYDTSGNAITSFGGGTQYDEDTAHVSGDKITMAGVVQQSTDAALSSNGDRSVLQVDGTGYLKVNVKAGSAGGTEYADGAARGTATGTLIMGDDGTNIQSISVDSSGRQNINNISGTVSLPTGAATAALQTQPGVDIGDVTVNNASGASAVNIQDGGNSITVDGSVTVTQATGTNLHAVIDSGTVTTVSTVTNLSQLGGTAISMNTGTRDAGTQRVTIATNDSVPVTGPLTDAQLRATAVPTTDPSRLFIGRASTFSTPGRAGTTGQKILSLHNATGSAVTVRVRKVVFDMYQTVVKAVTVAPPTVRLWKVTVLPTNGTTLTKVQIGGTTSSSSSVTVLGDASADGTGSGTTLTATLPAGTIITQEYCPRMITAASYENADRIEFLDDTCVVLNALEGVVLFLDYTLATQNPTTDRYIAAIEWDET